MERDYHDLEWGVPVFDDRQLFAKLVLDGAQAGLSWLTILRKQAAYFEAFEGLDPERVARMGPSDVERLLCNPGIVRNRRKVESALNNARRFLDLAAEKGSFAAYLWSHVDYRPIVNQWTSMSEVPAASPVSDALARDLKRRGFTFAGSTILYAYMQAVGLVNDHLLSCFRHAPLARGARAAACRRYPRRPRSREEPR